MREKKTTFSKEKFKSIDSLREELEFMNQFTIFYNGERYEIEPPWKGGKFSGKYLMYKLNDNGEFDGDIEFLPNFATFDEMLDNFKAHDGKTMREFILEAFIEWADVDIGSMGETKRWKERQKTNPNAKHPYPEAKGQFNLKIGEGNGGLDD